ncbi:unnamed protein product [Ostreobium quekettii]|uniref:Uncharacterized protein n=1 Tax=Ostreobium quekettii TaxID=121088 RepID=A0A8S1J0E1_9CHLO|nr:unnamed protein product [Ostreobium quekettii]|eukprot:evm.model.scf_1107EXC.1 EVM.evm.TU.scf_1107EXC.1   scf_1107EXC:8592-15750(+)
MSPPRFAAGRALLACLLLAGFAAGFVQFEPVHVPRTDREKTSVVASLKVTYGDISANAFNKIARTREDHNCFEPGCTFMGEVLDITNSNVTAYNKDTLEPASRPARGNSTGRRIVEFSHAPSGGILLEQEEVRRWFMLYQFEGPNPGTLLRVRMRLENDTDLATLLTVPVPFVKEGGLWLPRSATLTPGGAYLGTEGLPPDGRLYFGVECMLDDDRSDCMRDIAPIEFFNIMDFMRYFRRTPDLLKEEGALLLPPAEAVPGFKPYRYGYPFEISLGVDANDRVLDDVAKHYAMGRLGARGIAVMQDGFNVYISGGHGGLYRFRPSGANFEAGELFAASIVPKAKGADEVTIEEGDVLEIKWISIGENAAADVEGFTSGTEDLNFGDIFSSTGPVGGECPEGFERVALEGNVECLRIVGEELAAVFEPERLATIKGASTNVFRFSQMATKLDADVFYLAADVIRQGALDAEDGRVNVNANPCGCVFEVNIDEDFLATSMKAILCGDDVAGVVEGNTCNTERIANPRSLTFANKFENLLIGEDTAAHTNNFLWAWDPETGRATRIFHASKEGRITSVNWFQDVVGGNNYIGVTIANPFDTFGWMSYFGSFDLSGNSNKLTFSNVPVPYAEGPREIPIGFSRLTTGNDELIGGWTPLYRTGEEIEITGEPKKSLVVGRLVDQTNKPVDSYKDGPVKPERVEEPDDYHRFAFTSLINMCDKVFSIGVVDALPAVSYVFTLVENGTALETVSASYIDWSEWGGLWQSGGGVMSPWNTHLGGEAFEPNGQNFRGFGCLTGFSSCFKSRAEDDFSTSLQFLRYFDRYVDDLDNSFPKLAEAFNPYAYGYAYEVKVNKFGCAKPMKHLTLGRFSHGAQVVMPDQKTVYMTDWTTGREVGGGLFKFIADTEADLSSGTLYAAKFKPVRGNLNKYGVSWIELGSANNDELVEASQNITFEDMFTSIPPSKTCKLQEIFVKSGLECLEVKEGMETMAAFFETRRYAALQGASIELANTQGLTFDPNSGKAVISFTRISQKEKVMVQDDIEGSTNDVKVTLAPCGCLFSLDVTTEFDITGMDRFYCGDAVAQGETQDENVCGIERPANPGRISNIPGHGLLLVSEDNCLVDSRGIECGHENGVMWAMDSRTGRRGHEFTRILTAPKFNSLSDAVWYPNIQGKAYISGTINELYSRSSNTPFDNNDPEAVFGYMGPFADELADARREVIKSVEPKCYEDIEAANGDGVEFQCPASAPKPAPKPVTTPAPKAVAVTTSTPAAEAAPKTPKTAKAPTTPKTSAAPTTLVMPPKAPSTKN